MATGTMSKLFFYNNKKVILRDRKRRTARAPRLRVYFWGGGYVRPGTWDLGLGYPLPPRPGSRVPPTRHDTGLATGPAPPPVNRQTENITFPILRMRAVKITSD